MKNNTRVEVVPATGAMAAVVIAILIVGGVIAYSIWYSSGSVAAAQSQTRSSGVGTITVSATGTVYAYPSQGQLYLAVNGSGSTTQLATANLSATLSALNTTLGPYVNGNLSLISTTSYNLYKAYNKTSYVASEGILVTLPNVSNVTPALNSLSYIPNVYVNGVSASLSNQQASELRGAALTTALSNATSQAAILGGNGVVTPVNITVNNYGVFLPGIAFSAASASTGSLFYSGMGQVTESITVLFRVG